MRHVFQAIWAACWVVAFALGLASSSGKKDPLERTLRRARFKTARHWYLAFAAVALGWLGFVIGCCSLTMPD